MGENGIEEGTPKTWSVYAAQRQMTGPKSMPFQAPVLPDFTAMGEPQDVRLTFCDTRGRPLQNDSIGITPGHTAELSEQTGGDGAVLLKDINAGRMSLLQKIRIVKGE